MEQATPVLIGYMRVSKADGSQVLDLQRDALLAAGVVAEHLYEDLASGRRTTALASPPAVRRCAGATPWSCGTSLLYSGKPF